jgi:hypothetical protein
MPEAPDGVLPRAVRLFSGIRRFLALARVRA